MMKEPINKNFSFGPKSFKASEESKSSMSYSNSVRKSYGTNPLSVMNEFIKVIRGYGKSFGVAFMTNY